MQLSLFDLHCDTAGEMLRQGQGLETNNLSVSLSRASVYSHYIQVMAHWTDHALEDEAGWQRFLAISDNLKRDPAAVGQKAEIVTEIKDKNTLPQLLLSVEDVRIVAGQIQRMDVLYDLGVRIVTPLWKGLTSIGGSHDTDRGLTPFGKAALSRAAELGMILDISHASVPSAEEIFAISEEFDRPVIASHSNAYEICAVSRNLHDSQAEKIIRSDGLIGLNLHQAFLRSDAEATAKDMFPHIDHFLTLGAEDHLALGCDMDGCDLPLDIPDVGALPHLAELMAAHGYSDRLIQNIFFENAYRFAKTYICK